MRPAVSTIRALRKRVTAGIVSSCGCLCALSWTTRQMPDSGASCPYLYSLLLSLSIFLTSLVAHARAGLLAETPIPELVASRQVKRVKPGPRGAPNIAQLLFAE